MPDSNASFLGRGWSFPPTFIKSSTDISVLMVSAEQNIRENLEVLLTTIPGERVVLPTFGADTTQLVFEELDASFEARFKNVVTDAILYFEPRIKLESVKIEMDNALEGIVNVSIDYTIRAINTRSNFVFPYFLIEGTEIKRI